MRDYKVIRHIPESDSFIIEKKTKDFEGRKLISMDDYNKDCTLLWDGPILEQERIKVLKGTPLNKKAQSR